MKGLDWNIELDNFEDMTPFGKKKFSNIIATHNMNACKRFVIACHFDSKYFKEFEFIGAVDSAVPCAIVIHLAQLLHQRLINHKNAVN